MNLKEAVGKVLEGWTLPNAVRKILEEAYFDAPQRTWVGLTDGEKETLSYQAEGNTWTAVELAAAKLRTKNGY